MSYGGEGVARMRVLQVVVLIVFGVIAARLAANMRSWPGAMRCATKFSIRPVARCSTATANIWYRVASVMT